MVQLYCCIPKLDIAISTLTSSHPSLALEMTEISLNTSARHETSEEHSWNHLGCCTQLSSFRFPTTSSFGKKMGVKFITPPHRPLFPLRRSHGSHRRIGLQHGSAISAKDLRTHSLKLPEFPVGPKNKCSVTFFFQIGGYFTSSHQTRSHLCMETRTHPNNQQHQIFCRVHWRTVHMWHRYT